MKRIILYDNRSKVLGYVETDANGNQKIYDKSSRLAGYYNAKVNQTLDGKSRFVGTGNLLGTLLK